MVRGRFWKFDSAGNLLNDSAREKIDRRYEPVLGAVSDAYRRILNGALGSVYITGSVSRGMQRPEKSDIDFIAVLKPNVGVKPEWAHAVETEKLSLSAQYRWISKFDLEIWEHSYLTKNTFSIFSFVLKVHSVLLFGEDLSGILPDFRLSPEIARDDVVQIGPDISEALEAVRSDSSEDNVRYWAQRISKNIVRSCFGLEMMNAGAFTRDLELCAQAFLEKHPGKTDAIHLWLSQSGRAMGDAKKLSCALEEVSTWLNPAAQKWQEHYSEN